MLNASSVSIYEVDASVRTSMASPGTDDRIPACSALSLESRRFTCSQLGTNRVEATNRQSCPNPTLFAMCQPNHGELRAAHEKH
jgi:hypothetical protein